MAVASDVMDRAAALLNDAIKATFTYTAQLPYLIIASEWFGDELNVHGLTALEEVSADVTIPASTTPSTWPSLPSNFVAPLNLFEKASGENDDKFVSMSFRQFPPNQTAGTVLGIWSFRNQTIEFPPCSVARVVRMHYRRLQTVITTQSTPIEINNAMLTLAYYTASLCAMYLGRNEQESERLEGKAYFHLYRFMKIRHKPLQRRLVRRRGFRISRRRVI